MDKSTLQPQSVFKCFAQVNQIPRPSKHEEKMIEFLLDFGNKLGLDTRRDEAGNVIIRKPATPGMENRETIVLQSHMDMVCEKNRDLEFDFSKDAIQTYVDGEWMKAKGTTLGADDGLGVAAIMAVFESKTIKHGPLEALITTDEETGMTGAFGLKANELKGEFLLNLDSETEGELYVGCAGGVDATLNIPYSTEKAPKDYCAYKLSFGGLKGGHSGMEINTGRANVNKLMFRHLRWVAECGLRLISISGGNMRNAIPRDAEAVIAFPKEHTDCILAEFDKVAGWVKKELASVEPDFFMKYEKVRMTQNVISDADTQKIINLMMVAPNGVIRMSRDMEGLVETSLNLAIVKTTGKNFTVQALLRSSVDTAKDALAERLVCLAEMAGGTCKLTGAYPGWKPNMQSPLLKTMKQTYKKLYKKEPAVVAIHAGLECGLLGGKYPDMDMISFGPTLQSPHSPDERANIPSSKKFFDFLVAALEAIPEKK